MKNRYEVSDGVAYVYDCNNECFMVDASEITKIAHIRWRCRKGRHSYVVGNIGKKGKVYLHRFIMGVAGFVLDTFIAGPIAKKKAAKLVNPTRDNPFMMVLAISVFSVLFMCPMMSFVATILFKGAWGPEVIAVWLETTVKNFPMAFFWQLMIAGPLVRGIFGKIFSEKKTDKKTVIQEG